MGKVRGTEYKPPVTDHRAGCDPVDRNEQWLAIYAILKANIGEWPAFNWFSHVRFLAVHNDSIRLEHWCAWGAREALNRHGMALCKAAGVSKAAIRYNGGTVPKDCAARKVDGHADYVVPQQIAASTAEYRRRFAESTLGGLWVK